MASRSRRRPVTKDRSAGSPLAVTSDIHCSRSRPRPTGPDVHQQRPAAVAAAQRELIHARHPRRLGHGGIGQGADQPDQRRPAHPGVT